MLVGVSIGSGYGEHQYLLNLGQWREWKNMTNLLIGLDGLMDRLPVINAILISTFVPILDTGTEVGLCDVGNGVNVAFYS